MADKNGKHTKKHEGGEPKSKERKEKSTPKKGKK
ncbi:hypothetical protein UFOVP357_70 [uncultured Caudovirales phage]|uniref:Uncharacterized protein n=1 Tax=uncultured Caudovirales phage TaxID=2100421 RepID=A0A6J7WTJ4_9CAUD|nr:hypothetical protein UFOVP357_70 [uncultured Caudovirales phage]